MDWLYYENLYGENGLKTVCGVDEAGRGPLAGSVYAAAVILPQGKIIEGVNDSKKLSEKKRDKFYEIIKKDALAIGIGECTEKEIDELNIYEATKVAMKRAIEDARKQINIEHVLIDAMPLDIDIPTTSIIKGDAKSITIAAASVIAKVTRDKMMYELDKKYPMYDLAKNKGYPTKKHLSAIEEYGITEYHRLSYGPVKKFKNKINKTKIG